VITIDRDINSVSDGIAPITNNTLSKLNLAMMIQTKTDDSQVEKDKLKLTSTTIIDKYVSSTGLSTNSTSQLYGGSMISGQLYLGIDKNVIEAAKNNSLPVYNITQCDIELKNKYNITKILYSTNNINSILNKDNTSVYSIKAYDYQTKQKLDLSVCSNITQDIAIPIDRSLDLNLTYYKDMKDKGVDIYNRDDPVFNDRCMTVADPLTGKDTTLTWRRNNIYQQKQPMCIGVNCTYKGIDEFDYISCSCTGLQSDSEFINQVVDYLLVSISEINIGVVFCYMQIPVFYI
jgi:hypothetical protein